MDPLRDNESLLSPPPSAPRSNSDPGQAKRGQKNPGQKNPGWILVSGLALFSLGLTARSQDQPPTANQTQSIPYTQGYGTADSNRSMIAVTGIDVTGGSILYLVDTESRHLSVYAAQGGTASTMNIKWVGARNIDLDLQVNGFNDKSTYSFDELDEAFETGEIPRK